MKSGQRLLVTEQYFPAIRFVMLYVSLALSMWKNANTEIATI